MELLWIISATQSWMPQMKNVIQAAKAAHVHHFISTLPDGYRMIFK